MKRGLLLVAFLTTLILDMGVGPVLIVFGSVNLSKQTSYPSAAWLLVRGIVNCVQFLSVMLLTWIVSHTNGKYSRKEETILVARLLTTHPLAYFYYLLILFGIVWNVLGSCWIAAAFRHYSVGFASCYLVGVILAWISVIASPFFVFSGLSFVIASSIGGLFYGKLKKYPTIQEAAIQLVSPVDTSTSITDILNNLHNDGIAITAEDILNMSRQRDSNLKEPMITLTDDQKPVVVSDITPTIIIPQEESLLDMFTSHQERDHGVIIFQRDVLDDENPTQESVWNPSEELTAVIPIEIKEEDISVVDRIPEVQEEVTEEEEEVTEEIKEETTKEEDESTPQPVPSRKRKKEKKKKKEEYVNPKERIVLADEQISIPTIETPVPVSIQRDDDYIDLSIQMRDAINRGEFDHHVEDENMFTSSLSHIH